MDQLDAMRVFVRVLERRSFVQAAQDLGLSRSRVSEAIRQLEHKLGVRLLARTTRQVTPTPEGENYYQRVIGILTAVDDADAAIAAEVPAGPLRIDVHGTFARRFLLPAVPDFLRQNPGIRLHISEGDRLVDLIGEGVDCALRIGEPADSGLVGRRLGTVAEGTFASPDYLASFGTPTSIDDLSNHRMIGFVSTATRALIPLEFQTDDGLRTLALPVSVTVTAAATYACLAKLGLGLVQAPRYRVAHELSRGDLVEVLPSMPPQPSPVYLLYPESRQLSPRVRIFVEWGSKVIASKLLVAA